MQSLTDHIIAEQNRPNVHAWARLTLLDDGRMSVRARDFAHANALATKFQRLGAHVRQYGVVLIVTEDIDTKLANDKLQRVTGNAPQARRMRDYHNTPWSENPERLAAHLDRLAF